MAEPPIDDRPLMDVIWERVSARLGGTSETVQKIKFGRGAVGKISVITVAAVLAIGGMALRLGASGTYVGICGVVLVALASFGVILYIVCKRPELAVMEGAELVMYQHVTLGAKGRPSFPLDPTPAIPPLDANLPKLSDTAQPEGLDG